MIVVGVFMPALILSEGAAVKNFHEMADSLASAGKQVWSQVLAGPKHIAGNVVFLQPATVLSGVYRKTPKPAPNSLHSVSIHHKMVIRHYRKEGQMSKSELQPRQDRLVDKYREIGPAVPVAALLNATRRSSDGRNDNRRRSILTVKETG
ncbi:hypothetical protein CN880_09670 [Ochrobactrum sp. 720/2009]|nr:hypothetical protein CN880_09670 [Ochrobactrum sp. 720/2009]